MTIETYNEAMRILDLLAKAVDKGIAELELIKIQEGWDGN